VIFSTNARFLTDQGAGQLVPQPELTPQRLAELLTSLDRDLLQSWAQKARSLAKLDAVGAVVQACEELVA
jgi:UDP-N-acetylglucosamine--N-acetylmuramyl-(pentapeptide) pyrophosphoryl-undecaprenol N-acetylglucosamine transferase